MEQERVVHDDIVRSSFTEVSQDQLSGTGGGVGAESVDDLLF
jgi:hypothetical protein